ncbi:uncharacterized protein E0L32_007291 [Thyridium curvatum]|uniref:THO complex subunit 2 n=1 Tax=Thyridium curvatum TaxID=1093900 RepID=A0A507B555_9PEZI|nr:uncharacterized protein E0L32_007291 [Thyridium curvatum]TPX11988.1 hypothetical protein E0L32_007291 [Thyridium curvatum]
MPPKRKRPERGTSDSGGGRPSPHRPEQTMLGQHDRGHYDGGGRGGRGGRNMRRNDRRDFSQNAHPSTPTPANSTPAAPRSPTLPRPPSAPSQPALAPPATVVAPAEPAPSEPVGPINSGYIYEILTNECLGRWQSGARQEIESRGVQARQNNNAAELSGIVQEFIHSVVDLRIDPVSAGTAVKEIIGPRPDGAEEAGFAFDPHVLFLDCVSIILEVEGGVYRTQLRDFMATTEVSTTLARQVLDPDLLNQLGLLRNTFPKMAIRQSTNLLYRQANYNLLREESEGFSKLMTELYASCANAAPDYSFTSARTAFDRVKALIGTFDLDVGRTLDVTLDVFATTVIKHPKFFVKFLRISSWWPRGSSETPDRAFLEGLPRWAQPELADKMTTDDESEASIAEERRKRDVQFWDRVRETHLDAFFELGGREVADGATRRVAEIAGASPDDDADDDEQRWIRITKTLPPQGNRIAAQILGFKLRFYTSEFRNETDVLPANILYLAALLVKIGFVSLCDLYPHLWPLDQDMAALREKKEKELKEKERKNRPGGAMNALMMADALPDDMPPPGSTTTRRDALSGKQDTTAKEAGEAASQKPKLPEPLDQKVQLLEHLLTIGALPESLYILGRFPWIVDTFPDTVLPLIHRIIKHSLTKVAEESQPAATVTPGCPPKKMADADQSGVPKGSVRQSELVVKRPLRWPFPDRHDVGDGQTYRFYFDEWVDTVPVCQTVDDVFSLCNSFINVSGVNIGRDPELLAKIADIGLKSLKDDRSEGNLSRWHDLLKRLLVPALSLSPPSPSINDAIWNLLQFYPTAVRYAIYAEWYEGATSRLPAVSAAFARSRLETLSTMKRLSLTNIKTMARTLAKTTYSSPGIVFKVALDQIEAYSNLIQVFVECGKYFTHLGHDVLVWSLMSALGGKQRSRTQETSVLLTSKWLQALSKFSGNVFKRYSIMDPTPVIQYVNDQLLKGNSTDLVILKELILTMGGLVSDMDFTDAQLRAMSGGKILRRQTLISLQDKRFESTKSAKRLMQALVDTRLAGRLLINIAQYRQAAIYKASESESHIKYLSTVVDDSHQVFVQYLDLLRSNLEFDQFDDLVPDIGRLMGEFGLDVTLAFMIRRAGLAHRLLESPASVSSVSEQDKSQSNQPSADKDGDVTMNGGDAVDGVENPELSMDKTGVDEQGPEAMAIDSPAPTTNAADKKKSDVFFDVLRPAIDSVQAVIPEKVWKFMSAEFYVIFWSLQLGDLAVPRPSYEAAHALVKKQAEDVMKDRSDMSRNGMDLKYAKRDELMELAKNILQEAVHHAERNQKLKIRLLRQSSTWFPGTPSDADAISDSLVEQCVFPRLLLSASDTEYAFRLLKFLHENKTPNFKLMSFYERLFQSNRLRDLIFSCTVREAEHLGRFFRCILGDLSRWHSDKTLYEKEALGHSPKDGRRTYLGFAESFDDDGKPLTFVQHPQFRDLLYGWHKNLNIALKDCLENTEWMHIRNAITVLKFVLEFFPAVDFMGRQFAEQLKKITEREAASKTANESEAAHRVDLSVAAQTAFSELQRRKSKWVMVQAFRPNASGKAQEEPKAGESTSLRPTAPEFKPKGAATAAAGQSANEAEDGEVKDGKAGPTDASTAGASSRAGVPNKPAPAEKDPKRLDAATPATSSRPSTPKPSPATTNHVPGRPETSRTSGLTSLPHPSSLPNRPDVPAPGRGFGSDRFGPGRNQDRRETAPRDVPEPRERNHRDSRDPREPNHPRDLRDGRDFRTPEAVRSRDSSGPDRRTTESASRDPPRHSERDRSSRNDSTPRRQDPQPPERDSRTSRDRQSGAGRGQDRTPARDVPTATPSTGPASQQAPQDPSVNPERARLIATNDRPDFLNPARAALFNDSRSAPTRGPREESKDRASSRGQSPKASDGRSTETPISDRVRDGRQSRPAQNDPQGANRDGQNEGGNATPKDRSAENSNDRANTDRGFRGQGPRQQESDHGRLSHQDPNYGRLNPIQSVADNIPSGPRGRGRDSNRMSSMNAPPRPDARFSNPETPRAPSPDRQPPSGPSSSRGRRGRGGQYESNPNPQSPAAGTASPSAGLHPDRARHLNNVPAPPHGSGNFAPPPPNSSVGVHPDRLNQIAPPPPPPPPPPHPSRNSLPQHSSPMTSGPPGPRGQPGNLPATPGGDHRGNHSTPTGPSPSNERTRNRGERMIRGIQDTISGGGGRRGAGHRGQIAGSDAQVLTGGSPVTTPVFERSDPMRRDPGPDRPPAGPNGEDHERGGRRDHRSDRSGRPSRRSSRERSPDRDREAKPHREHRDRRSDVSAAPAGPGATTTSNSTADRRPGRESSGANRDAPPIANRDPNREPLGGGRESRQRGEGRGDGGPGRPAEEWSGNGRGTRGGGGPRGGDEQRRDGREDRGRKRRSEDGAGLMGNDREKRQRR